MNSKYETAEYQERVAQFVNREVNYCVSGIVHTLANGYGSTEGDLSELCEKAFELSCPIDDWADTVFDHVRNLDRDSVVAYLENWGFAVKDDEPLEDLRTAMISSIADEGERDFCEENNLDPFQREIYEHWIVSKFLANRLDRWGEKVDFDFDGLIIWGRTTTGQSISMDHLITQVYDEMKKEADNI